LEASVTVQNHILVKQLLFHSYLLQLRVKDCLKFHEIDLNFSSKYYLIASFVVFNTVHYLYNYYIYKIYVSG